MKLDVLGVPVEVEAASPAAMDVAARAIGAWRREGEESGMPARRLRVSLAGTRLGGESESVAVNGGTLSICSAAGRGWADPSRGRAGAFLHQETLHRVDDAEILLEALAVYLAQTAARPVTLHAAALVWKGRCVLVSGAEGAGKSTLSYACVRAGFGLVSEDACFAAGPDPALQVWGIPWRLNLLPDSARLYPALQGAPRARMLNGEEKVRVRLPTDRPVRDALVTGVILLRRSERESAILPLEDERELAGTLVLRGGPTRPMEPTLEAAEVLARGPSTVLRFGPDICNAVELLRQWVESL